MSEEQADFESLPLEERLNHKLWKARLHAYNELKNIFDNSTLDSEVCFDIFLRNPETLRKIITDSNVVAQETAVEALCSFLEHGNSQACLKTRSSVVPSLCDKCLSSSRSVTKQKSIDALLWYIELDTPDPILELIIPSTSAKSPKLVAATTNALNEIYKAFGCKVCSPKLVIPIMPNLFAHADKNVRSAASELATTLRSYMGESFDKLIFSKLKPIQQKDLTKEFSKIVDQPMPQRLLRSQQKVSEDMFSEPNADGDIEMQDSISVSFANMEAIDAYNLAEPVNVLSKLPSDLSSNINSSKWKDRVEALENIIEDFKVLKIGKDDYSDFIRLMVKCLKDANVQVVTLASNIIVYLANGLRMNFEKYVSALIIPILERTKEKKKSVVDALSEALDVCFLYSSFSEILEPTLQHMMHKTPQIKIESSNFIIRCLKNIEDEPKKAETNSLMEVSTKLLMDSQLAVRNSAAEVIGTLMKIIGPKASKQYFEKIDSRHQKKIENIAADSEVKIKFKSLQISKTRTANDRHEQLQIRSTPKIEPVSNATPRLQLKKTNQASTTGRSVNANLSMTLKKPSDMPLSSQRSTVPSKRGASSPLKEGAVSSKMNLTSRSLKPSLPTPSFNASASDTRELENLRKDKLKWDSEKELFLNKISELRSSGEITSKENVALGIKLDEYKNKFTTMNLSLKSKDTQIYRLQNDLENSRSRFIQMEQKLQYLQQQFNSIQEGESKSPKTLEHNNSFETKSSELNRRISTLSIDSNVSDRESGGLRTSLGSTTSRLASGFYEMDDNDDSWRRATTVTNELKAKIQRMKARTRTLNTVDESLI